MSDLASAWDTLDQQEADRWRWLEGPRISFDDVNKGSATIERVTTAVWMGGAAIKSAQHSTARPAASPNVMWFGKRRGDLMIDVKEDDRRYWDWLVAEVPGFAAKVRKAGLLDDDADRGGQDDNDSEFQDAHGHEAHASEAPNQ